MNINEIPPEKRESYLLGLFSNDEPNRLYEGFGLLTWACWEKRQKVIRLGLCRDFVDPNVKNEDGTTALTWSPSSEITNLLVEHGARVGSEEPDNKKYSVHFAAASGRRDQLEILINKGGGLAFLGAFNELGETPLSIAAREGHIDAVGFLLDVGSDPNAFDLRVVHNTVLQNAICAGNEVISNLLLNRGARVETHGLRPTPWELASEQGFSPDLLTRLEDCVINPDIE